MSLAYYSTFFQKYAIFQNYALSWKDYCVIGAIGILRPATVP